MRNRGTALTLAALLLAGCTLAPRYERPQAPVSDQWPAGPAYVQEETDGAAAAADLAIDAFFTEPRLVQVIDMALASNRDLRTAALNVERARAYYRISRAELLPKINATGTGYKGRVPADLSSSGSAMTVEEYNVNLGITAWEIDLFGRIRSLKARALEEFLATEAARRGARILLVSETAGAWLTLAADTETLDLAQSTLATRQVARDMVARRVEVGLAAEIDLHQAQTQVDEARSAVARLTAQVAKDRNALNLLAGGPVPEELLPRSLDEMTVLPDLAAGTPSEILLNRPDIRQAESRLKAAYANIGAARAAFFPSITLTGTLGTASSELSGLFDTESDTWSFAPKISMPIFDPRTWSALKVTKVDREIALAQYEKAIQTAFREVADTLASRGTLQEQLDAQASLVRATAEICRIAQARYDAGAMIYLGVLDAQRSLYAARQGLIAVRLADMASRIRLYAVLGGGQTTAEPREENE
nr:efflux transporter outer membrane subunit [Desulfosudis oleivorans]